MNATDWNAVYTSEAATTSLAGRVTRGVRRDSILAFRSLVDVIRPAADKISERGKLRREELEPAFDALVRRLEATENIIGLAASRVSPTARKRVSVNEGYACRFNQVTGLDENWMLFLATDIKFGRRQIEMLINTTEFHVSRHLLARYMQRGRQHYLTFLGTVLRPMRLAALLSAAKSMATIEGGRIALPIDGGLLAGTVSVYSSKGRPFPMRITFDRDGVRDEIDHERNVSNAIVITRMRTFIDRDSLSRKKFAVLNALEAWEREHRDGIIAWFEALNFGTVRYTDKREIERVENDVNRAMESCRELIASREWQDL